MILLFLITTFFDILQALFDVIPNIPATPAAIETGGDWIITNIVAMVSLLRMILGSALVSAGIVIGVAIMTFDQFYYGILWIIKKIPYIAVK